MRGAPRGPLHGRTVALKDNVCLAGVPMMNGASTLKGYTPDVDATVVARLLDAGATIAGKAHCEYFCLSGGSHTNAMGPVENPHRAGYSAGGSSSGSGALVGGGFVDMAIGGDQGGSIRIPSSYCGCYGMKPTHGLVPLHRADADRGHHRPYGADDAERARQRGDAAGDRGRRRSRSAPVRSAGGTTTRAPSGAEPGGLRIAVVKEGFGHPASEPDVDAKVRSAAEAFKRLGATVDEISIPGHLHGLSIWTPIALEGLTDQMMLGNGMGTGWEGMYTTSLLDFHANWRSRADELSDTLKICMFMGQYYLKHHRGHYYAKAQNLVRRLRAEYDRVFGAYDLLLMPTLPMKATPLPPADAPLALYCQRAFEMLPNTAPFNVTGHPAMSIPCGMSDGLPVGTDAGGRQVAGGRDLPRRRRLRAGGRLEGDVALRRRLEAGDDGTARIERAVHRAHGWPLACPGTDRSSPGRCHSSRLSRRGRAPPPGARGGGVPRDRGSLDLRPARAPAWTASRPGCSALVSTGAIGSGSGRRTGRNG